MPKYREANKYKVLETVGAKVLETAGAKVLETVDLLPSLVTATDVTVLLPGALTYLGTSSLPSMTVYTSVLLCLRELSLPLPVPLRRCAPLRSPWWCQGCRVPLAGPPNGYRSCNRERTNGLVLVC